VGVEAVETFLGLLKESPPGAVFNPWWEIDRENDIGVKAPRIRREQLRAYLSERIGSTRLAFIGEALGYRGGHFTGIAMTSERILLGGKKDDGIAPSDVFSSVAPRRTSNIKRAAAGFSEPTASIVWSALLRSGLGPREFVLWNTFPWHSFDPRAGMLSNRMPTKGEVALGEPVLKAFFSLFQCDFIAVGQIAAGQLSRHQVPFQCVRHPASGGATLFRQQLRKILGNL
jgi:hypothetical protein